VNRSHNLHLYIAILSNKLCVASDVLLGTA
jgi:hypothetical protein